MASVQPEPIDRVRMTEGEASPPLEQGAKRTRPAGNATYLAAANIAGKAFSLIFVLYANRALQPALMGSYGLVLSFVGLFGVLTDLGLSSLVVRDVATDRTRAVRYISNTLALRTALSVVVVLLIVVAAQFAFAPAWRGSVYVFALSLIPIAMSNTLQLAFQFSERLAYSAILNVATSAATAGLSILVLLTGHHVLGLVTAFTVVATVSSGVVAWLVYTRFLPLRFEFDPAWWPAMVRMALPFAVMTILNIIYNSADRQILGWLSHCQDAAGNTGCPPVGEYSAAYRPLDILITTFAGSMNAAVLPALIRVGATSHETLVRLIRSGSTLGLVIGVPVAVLTTFFAPETMHVFGGKNYMVAAPALATLIWAFPCVLVLILLYGGLYAVHRNGVMTVAFAVTLVFNLSLNILLIPRFSYLASAALTVASEVLNGVIVVVALRQSVGALGLVRPTAKMAVIAIGSSIVLWALHPFGIFVGAPVGVAVMLLGIKLTRILGSTERDVLGRLPIAGRFVQLL